MLEEPTATQFAAVAQDTEERALWKVKRLGLATIDHRVPFQCSTKILMAPEDRLYWPTATQVVAVVHDTPERKELTLGPGLGLVMIDHFAPFQCSTKVIESPEVV